MKRLISLLIVVFNKILGQRSILVFVRRGPTSELLGAASGSSRSDACFDINVLVFRASFVQRV